MLNYLFATHGGHNPSYRSVSIVLAFIAGSLLTSLLMRISLPEKSWSVTKIVARNDLIVKCERKASECSASAINLVSTYCLVPLL